MAEERHDVHLHVNGASHVVQVPARRLLSDALRHDCGLTGTHVGCEHGVCGACTVLLDGQPVRSCLMLAVSAQRRRDHHGRGPDPPRRLAEPGAAGLLGLPRAAVRLLHAGVPHHDHRRPRGRTPTPTSRARPVTWSPATCAAAPATRTSWPRCCVRRSWSRPPRPTRRPGDDHAALRRQGRPGGGPATPARPGQVRRRPRHGPGHPARGGAPLAARSRPDHRHRRGGRPRPAPASTPCGPGRTSTARWPSRCRCSSRTPP